MEGNTEIQEPKQDQLGSEKQSLGIDRKGLLTQTEARLNQVLEDERKPGEPKISINIFYSAHGSAKDFEGLERQFQNADIYIPEQDGWTNEDLGLLNNLSCGIITPEEALRDYYMPLENSTVAYARDKKYFEMIYKSNMPITFIDLPDSHPILSRRKIMEAIFEIPFGVDFNQTLTTVRQYVQERAEITKERENYMITQLKPQVELLIKKYPELMEKKDIGILLSLGGIHTSLYHVLKKEGYQVERKFTKMPFVYNFLSEVERAYIFGKQVNDLLIARAAAELCFFDAFKSTLNKRTDDTQKTVELTRKVISRFSFDEIKNLFEGSNNISEWASAFNQHVSTKRAGVS